MLRRDDQLQEILRKKYKSIIIVELKNIWPEIIKNQRWDQNRKRNNRY